MENAATFPKDATRERSLNRMLWAAQVILAVVFGITGIMKLTMSIEGLTTMMLMTWAGMIPEWLVRFNGIAELAGAAGVLLPAITRRGPHLIPWAGYGLMTIMILAVGFHISHSGAILLIPNIVLGGLAAFVGWGRSASKAPIAPR